MNDTFGDMVLAVYYLLESRLIGAALTNNERDALYDRLTFVFRTSLVDYLNTQSEESKTFLDLCIAHSGDIANHNYDFFKEVAP